jgi:ABC-2 type transport system permease protein
MSSETYAGGPELAPSAMTDDQSSFARTVGMTGLFAVLIGVLILILNAANAKLPFEIGNNIGFAGIVVGLAMMFFHAARDSDELVRRLYGFVGGLGLPAAGAILSLLPLAISAAKAAPEGGGPKPLVSLFFPFGWACFLAGLFFLIPFCRSETDESQRRYGLMGLGGFGVVLALLGLVGGLVAHSSGFALTYGTVLALLGLAYLCALIGALGGADRDGYRLAVLVGVIGAVVFLIALGASYFVKGYFVPTGLILMALGMLYLLIALFLTSDWQLLVMSRRELASYFYSPVAYLVLLMSALIAWIAYFFFWAQNEGRMVVPEPVVAELLRNWLTIFPVLFLVPALTMRLISEERRTGTYEVLVCAPVSETPIIISKVIAAWVFYMLTWAVWAAVLIALRLDSGNPYDYRPLLSFYLAVAASGLAFVSMGVFFSTLTRNQIIAAVLTFFGMTVLLSFAVIGDLTSPQWKPLFSHLTYLWLWFDALEGRLHLRDVLIQVSLAVFWCFLAIKVLEARRWS